MSIRTVVQAQLWFTVAVQMFMNIPAFTNQVQGDYNTPETQHERQPSAVMKNIPKEIDKAVILSFLTFIVTFTLASVFTHTNGGEVCPKLVRFHLLLLLQISRFTRNGGMQVRDQQRNIRFSCNQHISHLPKIAPINGNFAREDCFLAHCGPC